MIAGFCFSSDGATLDESVANDGMAFGKKGFMVFVR